MPPNENNILFYAYNNYKWYSTLIRRRYLCRYRYHRYAPNPKRLQTLCSPPVLVHTAIIKK